MAIRKILVPLSGRYDPENPDSHEKPALEAAFVVGQRFKAHVEVYCVEARLHTASNWPNWLPQPAINDLIDAIAAENEKQRASAKDLFAQAAARFSAPQSSRPSDELGFSVEFIEHVGQVTPSLCERSRLADLIVVGSTPGSDWGGRSEILRVSLHQSGRPVLLAPTLSSNSIGESVLIAWNGSVEATRAVAMAMDFLSMAREVIIVSVEEKQPYKPSANDLADYLAWHNINPKIINVVEPKASSAAELLQKCAEADADLMIMGSYTRSRLEHLIFGSVTGEMLEGAAVPILMVD